MWLDVEVGDLIAALLRAPPRRPGSGEAAEILFVSYVNNQRSHEDSITNILVPAAPPAAAAPSAMLTVLRPSESSAPYRFQRERMAPRQSDVNLKLHSVRAENLRGYNSTTLPLDRSTTVIVGRNNSGKTSLLKLLNWLVNDARLEQLSGSWRLSESAEALLLPARDTPHRARRLTLTATIDDIRLYRRFSADANGSVSLRLNIRVSNKPIAYLALGEPKRGENPESSEAALEFLRMVRQNVNLIYVPSFRDAGSKRFEDTLLKSIGERVKRRALHHGAQGGAHAEYRAVKRAYGELKEVIEGLTHSLWPAMQQHLPPGIVSDGRVTMNGSVEDLIEWATRSVSVTVSTGSHDAATVPMVELGSGLQSLLDLAVQRSDANSPPTMLLIEEPESFLHPSAQRVITRTLLRDSDVQNLVLTTHSQVVVDEARYGEVVVCRDQRFYYPKQVSDTDREEINSALMTGQGAEMLFAGSVLLVEGESDRLYFEKLRRRLATADKTGRTDELFVVAVGGKQSFAPWIRLLESYGTPKDRPIQWLVAADADAAADIRRALNDAGVTVPKEVGDQIGVVGQRASTNVQQWTEAARHFNELTLRNKLPVILLPVDLEAVALEKCGERTRQMLSERAKLPHSDISSLLHHLGSKAAQATKSNPDKAPWIRGFLGAKTPWAELSADTRSVLSRWLLPVMNEDHIDALLSNSALDTTYE